MFYLAYRAELISENCELLTIAQFEILNCCKSFPRRVRTFQDSQNPCIPVLLSQCILDL